VSDLGFLFPGDVFGEQGLLARFAPGCASGAMQASVVAETSVHFLALPVAHCDILASVERTLDMLLHKFNSRCRPHPHPHTAARGHARHAARISAQVRVGGGAVRAAQVDAAVAQLPARPRRRPAPRQGATALEPAAPPLALLSC